jgi:parallel beta-helix repeat protein
MENGTALHNDLQLAYDNGAKYAIVFNYAGDNQPNPHEYGILTDEHFDALKSFWEYVQQNPDKHNCLKATTALVLPQGYGFGFRNIDDKIWGIYKADNWTQKIWEDTNKLLNEYGSNLDIVYSDPEFQKTIESKYSNIIPWTSGATSEEYPVLNLNNTLGYHSIQQAIINGATLNGDTIYVKSGTYKENIIIDKAVNLIGEEKETTILDGNNIGSVLRILASGANITNFTIKNGNALEGGQNITDTTALLSIILQYYDLYYSQTTLDISTLNTTLLENIANQIDEIYKSNPDLFTSAGIILSGADNCTIVNNIVTDNNKGIIISSSTNNTLKNNILINNKHGFGVIGQTVEHYSNYVDTSNSVNGKPIYYLINQHNIEVPPDTGFLALVNCTTITAQNLQLSNNYNGLLLVNTFNSKIVNNLFTDNYEGLKIVSSANNTLLNNNMNNNTYNLNIDLTLLSDIDNSNKIDGKTIYIWNNQQNKTIPEDAGYIALINCSDITVKNLQLNNNIQGIQLINTTNSHITNNSFCNLNFAIQVNSSVNNLITQNEFNANQQGIVIDNTSKQNKITNNIFNAHDSAVTISKSRDNTIQNNTLTNNQQAISLKCAEYNIIKANTLTSNTYGLEFTFEQTEYSSSDQNFVSTNNTIIENNFNQNLYGIMISNYQTAQNNTIYHNNFFNNTSQVYGPVVYNSYANSWDNGSEGNFWSNYNGSDTDGNGIGDIPMNIFQQFPISTGGSSDYYLTPAPKDQDRYPLMLPYSSPW